MSTASTAPSYPALLEGSSSALSSVNGFFLHTFKAHHALTNTHSFHMWVQQMTCKSMEWQLISRQPRIILFVSIHKSDPCHKTSRGNERGNLATAERGQAATGTHCLWTDWDARRRASTRARAHAIQQSPHSERATLQNTKRKHEKKVNGEKHEHINWCRQIPTTVKQNYCCFLGRKSASYKKTLRKKLEGMTGCTAKENWPAVTWKSWGTYCCSGP